MSFGGAGQGNIRYSIILDDTAAVQKIGQFKTALNGITQPSQALATNIGTLNTNFATISTGLGTTNTGFKTLGTGINGLAIPTRTLGTNMGVLNNNFKAFATTETQTVTQTNAFRTGITALTTPTQTVSTSMKSLVGSVGPLAGNFQKTTGAAKDMVVQQNNLGSSSKSLGSKIKDAGSRYGQFAVNMGTVATSAIQLIRNYRDLEDTQIAVDKSAKKLSTSHEAVDKATKKLQADTIKYGKNSKEVKQDTLDLSQATQTLGITEKVHAENLERQSDAYQDFSTSIIPTVISTVGTAASGFSDLGKNIKAGVPRFKELGSSIKAIPASLIGIGAGAIAGAGGLKGLMVELGPLPALLNNIKIAIDLLPKTFSLFTGDISQRIGIVKQWMDGLKNLSVTGGLAEILDKLVGISPELDRVAKSGKNLGDTIKTIPSSMNAAATSSSALVNRIIVLRTQAESGKITWNQYFDALAALKIPGDKFTAVMDEVNIRMKNNVPLTEAAAKSTHDFAQSGGEVDDALKKLGPGIVAVNKNTTDLNNAFVIVGVQLVKRAEDAKKFADALIKLTPGKTIIKDLFDQFSRPVNSNITQFNNLLKNWGGGVTDVSKKMRELANQSKFLAKLDELAWGAPATSRFANFKTFGTKAYDEIAAKAKEAADKTKAAWEKSLAVFTQNRDALKTTLKIESNVDKVVKDFVKNLSKPFEKTYKFGLKVEQKGEDITAGIKQFIAGAIHATEKGTFEFNPKFNTTKGIKELGKSIIEGIDSIFGGHKKVPIDLKGLETQITEAMKKGPDAFLAFLKSKGFVGTVAEAGQIPTTLLPPAPLPPPKDPVKVPSTFIPPPPIPSPKTPVKVPAVLVFGGSSNITKGSQAGAYGGPGKIGFGPPQSGGKKLKKIGGQYPNEFTQGGNDFQNRIDNARHKPEPEEDLGTHPIQGWPVSSGGGKTSNAAPQINIEMALKQVDMIAKRILGLSAIMPTITLNNAKAFQMIDQIVIRMQSLSTIMPTITLNNAKAFQMIDQIVIRINALTGIVPKINVDNAPAVKKIDQIVKRILDLAGVVPKINVNNTPAIKKVDQVAKRIQDLANIEPKININNTQAIKKVDQIAKRILDLPDGEVTIKVKTSGSTPAGTKFDSGGFKGDTSSLFVGGSKSDSSVGGGDTIINVHVMDETIMRRITARSGRGRFTMGA